MSFGSYEMSNPLIEPYSEETFMKPVYPQTASLKTKQTEKIIRNALLSLRDSDIKDPIPDHIRRKYKLCHEQYALTSIHFPKSLKDVDIARERLIFEELFILQCGLMMLRKRHKEKAFCKIENNYTNEFLSFLPFTLTNAQRRCINECMESMG